MTIHPSTRRTLLTRAVLPLMIAGMAVSLAGCGGTDGDGPSFKSSAISSDSESGLTIEGGDLKIKASTATAVLRGYSTQPVSVRVMSGWIDKEKAERAGKESDETKQRKEALASFGTVTVQVAAGKAEPGSYQLTPDSDNPETGTVIIDSAKNAGLPADYTSQSGTLTIKSVAMNESGNAVAAIAGTFDGKFSSDEGDSRDFKGSFQFVPKKK